MQLSPKERGLRSKRRQELHEQLSVWRDKETEALIKSATGKDVTKDLVFIRQEQAKLEKELRTLDAGFRRQRAWSQGKLNY